MTIVEKNMTLKDLWSLHIRQNTLVIFMGNFVIFSLNEVSASVFYM